MPEEAEQLALAVEAKKMVPLDRFIEYKPLQIRKKLDLETVKDYEEIVIQAGNMDPVVGWRIQGDLVSLLPEGADPQKTYYLMSSGWHRRQAYANLGKPVIPAIIKEGTLSDALEEAICSNSRHGKRLTNDDKRRAAELSVTDPVLGKKNDKWIANKLGVSVGFIAGVRKGLQPEDRRKKPPAAPREPDAKSNAESPAPKTATVRERKDDKEEKRPTAAACQRQIEEWVRLDILEESRIIKMFESGSGQYLWTKRIGQTTNLKVVNKAGRPLMNAPVVIQSANEEVIVVSTKIRDLVRLDEEGK